MVSLTSLIWPCWPSHCPHVENQTLNSSGKRLGQILRSGLGFYFPDSICISYIFVVIMPHNKHPQTWWFTAFIVPESVGQPRLLAGPCMSFLMLRQLREHLPHLAWKNAHSFVLSQWLFGTGILLCW